MSTIKRPVSFLGPDQLILK